jgi:hypothetical protein
MPIKREIIIARCPLACPVRPKTENRRTRDEKDGPKIGRGFDELVLGPRFGYVFQRRWLDPYESIIGMLWKFARLNRLPGHAVVMQLCRQPIDPYDGIGFCRDKRGW